MSSWRLEWLRLTRTPRALALAAVYVIFGLGEPVLTKYLNKILNHAGGAQKLHISIPKPVPSDGISAYVGQVATIGLIVVVVIAVGAFGILGAVGLTIVGLLALPIAALAHSIQNWLPSALVNAPVDLIGSTHLTHYLPAMGTSLVAAALLLIGATTRLRSREV